MRNFYRKLGFSVILSSILLFSLIHVSANSEPNFENITVTPPEPEVGDNVEITVTVKGGGNFESILLVYQECGPDICRVPENLLMEEIGKNRFRARINFSLQQATYFKYKFKVKSDGYWWGNDEYRKVYLTDSSRKADKGEDGFLNFRLITIVSTALVALVLIAIVARRRR